MFTQTTIKDVARIVGLHFTTVSMALRGHPAVAAGTRQRIENAAKLLGYQRNEVFSALSRQRGPVRKPGDAPTILYLGRGRRDWDFFQMPHHQQLLVGARREAKILGYRLDAQLVGPTGIFPDKLASHILKSAPAGVIIGAWDPTLEVPAVDWMKIPTVKIDSRHVPAQVPFVSFDQMACVMTSFRQAQAHGYRRIGIALGEKDEDATDGLHLSGWLVAQREFPRLVKIPPLFFPPGATDRIIVPLLRDWSRRHRVDAILCNWRSIKRMVVATGHPEGNRIALICLCCTPRERELAGIVPNFDLVGQRAVSLLSSIINTPAGRLPGPPLTSYVAGTWHDGPSLQQKN